MLYLSFNEINYFSGGSALAVRFN